MALSKIHLGRALGSNTIGSAKITDGTLVNADFNSCAAVTQSKTATGSTTEINNAHFNIALLGFKMAVTESLTVFNLVDGVVDEFHDESGADEAEGSNDTYNSTDDYYINSTTTDGASLAYSAGFGINNITEPDTSTAGTNPDGGTGTYGTFTVPTGISSVDIIAFGAGGGNGAEPSGNYVGAGAPGGYAEGTLAVTAGQTLYAYGGEGGNESGSAFDAFGVAMGGRSPNDTTPSQHGGGGGAAAGVVGYGSFPGKSQPQVYVLAAGGGGTTRLGPTTEFNANGGGGGGGLVGNKGGPDGNAEGTNNTIGGAGNESSGGGGDQEQGGQGGANCSAGQNGSDLYGGRSANTGAGGGGGGYYGGGGGSAAPNGAVGGHGGGGSSYYGHPQVTSGATEDGHNLNHPDGPNQNSPQASYDSTNANHVILNTLSPGLGKGAGAQSDNPGASGAVLITANAPAVATATTIISNTFTASSTPSTARMVVFQENVDTPTLNTDIIAQVSRNNGTTLSTVTLADEGYVTGSSGQRILAGTVDISGQPSGTNLRWKLTLQNNQVKVHGVSLAWA